MIFSRCFRWLQQKTNDFARKSSNLNSDESKEKFLITYLPQSEKDFLEICRIKECAEKVKVALSIRHVIAHLGAIDDEFIHSEMSFRDLHSLPFWKHCGDAGFNTFTFANFIASEVGFSLTDNLASSYPGRDPDLNLDMRICEFINEFYDWYSTRLNNS
jgi:hypothetical protein